jgi:glycosyltransferase involved in cell wall biosynthesis/thiamine kinase-like enzyme
MKILISAMACEPGSGSELEVGFRATLAAAQVHEVWVLTNKDSIPALQRGLVGRPEAERIHLEGIDFGVDAEGIALLTIPGFHFYYDRWQRKAAARAIELDRRVDFDVVHHVTLAAYWTRTGAAVLDKPLVWGPVGGGVEPPVPLLRELGWRGLLEDAGRVVIRRVLGRFGAARRAQRRAVITFAQNRDTLEKIRTAGRISVMTNATVVDLGHCRFSGTRTADVLFVGRLISWKSPILALRAFRYVRNPAARLVFCGDGPEQRRIQRAARRWGIEDRVQFVGWLPRDALLSRLATAGALLHPALHEEAGLCVAEALALATPVVCLDHGGPVEVLRQWPTSPALAVRPGDHESTARRFASAIDQFLSEPSPVPTVPRVSATSFERELLSAYNVAARMKGRTLERNKVWAFPRGKPQLFADSPRGIAKGVLVYAFGRRMPRLVQTGISLQMQVPGVRRLFSERRAAVEPVCGAHIWQQIADIVRQRNKTLSGEWLHFSSQWDKQRSSFLALNLKRDPELFLTIESLENRSLSPSMPASSYKVPLCRHAFVYAGWSVREFEPLPQFHQPARWDPQRIRQVTIDVSRALAGRLERPPDIPEHWLPMHGDLVPWNLREDDSDQLWLLDWEDAGWGPPLADFFRFIVAYYSLQWNDPVRIATGVKSVLAGESDEAVHEVTRFWQYHHNFYPQDTRNWPRQRIKDAARAARERAALRVLAGREHAEQKSKRTPRAS